MSFSEIQKNLLKQVADIESIPTGAYNIRTDGKLHSRNVSANIDIVSKKDKDGIDIIIKPFTKNERVDIPVILTKSGLKDLVYNDFYIGEGADVIIVAGCGICNTGKDASEHVGIHSFHVGKNAKIKYIEKHYGEGDGNGEKILNPTTEIEISEGGYMEMETAQIKGVDSSVRKTIAKLDKDATLIIKESIMTHGTQFADTDFYVDLYGENSSAHVISRSIAKDNSRQRFISLVDGNNKCSGHTECDAIIMNNGIVTAEPKINANHIEASLIHEATIGKIAGEQLTKLMTLGLTEKEAEEQIVNGFLK
ncbi:MAG: SufD family Fe-S cluster assembly protein [Clostridia bacterium]|nr:SufD family Fe-S cluster assembly protein [Clostridia bacterium]